MKTEEIVYKKKRLTLSVDDVKELLPDEKFHYEMYRDYRDEIDKDTFKECMPDRSKYKNDDGTIEHHNFAQDWRSNLEDKVREWNIDYITEDIDRDLTEKVKDALKKKGIEYDELELDFYPDDLYSIDLELDDVLKRSRIDWNVVWYNNFDGFNGMYTGSDLKVSFRHSMKDFLDIIDRGFIDLSGTNAVLHLCINGSGSSDFILSKGEVEFGKTYDSEYDYWDWELD